MFLVLIIIATVITAISRLHPVFRILFVQSIAMNRTFNCRVLHNYPILFYSVLCTVETVDLEQEHRQALLPLVACIVK